MLEDRTRQIAVTAVLSAAAVTGAYVLTGVAVAALVALVGCAVGVFVLGLHNAGVVAATVVAVVAVGPWEVALRELVASLVAGWPELGLTASSPRAESDPR